MCVWKNVNQCVKAYLFVDGEMESGTEGVEWRMAGFM